MEIQLNLKSILLSLLCFCCNTILPAQNVLFNLEENPVCIEQDAKGFFFVADEKGTLVKYNGSGQIVMQVNVKVYGTISKIDCKNPFEVYTYHKDQNIVVFYDNMLNIKGSLSLNNHYLTNVVDVARSYDNKLWLFDQSDLKLKKVLKSGNTEFESPNLSNILQKEVSIKEVRESENNIYLLDTLHGIHVFDAFGTFVTTHYLKNQPSKWFVSNGTIVFQSKERLLAYNSQFRDTKALFTLKDGEEIIGVNNGIYTLWQKKVQFYKMD